MEDKTCVCAMMKRREEEVKDGVKKRLTELRNSGQRMAGAYELWVRDDGGRPRWILNSEFDERLWKNDQDENKLCLKTRFEAN